MDIRAVAFDAYGTLFDTDSVATAVEEEYPRHGSAIVALWRRKQLEYTWLRSLMERYEDFWSVTRAALIYALTEVGVEVEPSRCDRLMDSYLRLEPFAEVPTALAGLRPRPLHIFSNGSPRMLETMIANAGLEAVFDGSISVDEARVYKPSPACYALVPNHLDLPPAQVLFVSSNPFDVAGGKNFGFTTVWVRRGGGTFEQLGIDPDLVVDSLADLPGALTGREA